MQGRASDDGDDNAGDHSNSWVRYQYNGDGVRVAGTGREQTSALLQDLAAPLPLLLQQTDSQTGDHDRSDDALMREFVWGLDLVSQTESRARGHVADDRDESREAWSAPLVNGLGSTRLLTDIRGQIRGGYAYSAFGVCPSAATRTIAKLAAAPALVSPASSSTPERV